MKIMYHATDYDNVLGIMEEGIKPGADGLVYLCEDALDAMKFPYIRGVKHMVTCKIKLSKREWTRVMETFDHSPAFFQCRAFGYQGVIPPENILEYMEYNL